MFERQENPLFLIMLLTALLLSPGLQSAHAVMNGTFDLGLTEWTTAGDVRDLSGEAGLGDNNESRSTLYQGVVVAPASFTLSFDFSGSLSADVPLGSFPDSFFASIYFIDDLGLFDPESGGFDDVEALLDLDHTGVSNVQGQLSASPKGAGWTRYSGTFINAYTYVVPTFEFFNLNGQNNDSLARLDNVTLLAVPEPGAWQLALSGIISLFLIRFLRNRLAA